ncbi:MAG: nucleoside recognition domain-containing protein [Deltaproteobacteria bacterium]
MIYRQAFLIIIPVLLGIFMVCNPQTSLAAARDGFALWYMVLLPALFPFFIVAEMLASSGFIRIIGRILEPVMRPLFNLPGCASLVVVMGFTSGFPVGAILSRRLYHDGLLTADETERLAAFTNNSSPLFIIGAVGVGLFGSPLLGYTLAAGHYLSNLLLGMILRFKPPAALIEHRHKDVLPADGAVDSIGQFLTSSIKNSLNNIIAIAGFVVLFSVLTRMLLVWGFIDYLAAGLTKTLVFWHIPSTIAYGMSMGFFEISIATRALSLAPHGDLLCRMLAVSAVLAFSGFSIIAQVTGFLADTPVRPSYYLLARLIQIALALPITLIAYRCLYASRAVPSMGSAAGHLLYSFDAWGLSLRCLLLGLTTMVILIMIGLTCVRE